MKKIISTVFLLIIITSISACSSSNNEDMGPDCDDSSAYTYEHIGRVTNGSEELSVMMLSELKSVYYRYTTLGKKETVNTIINFQDNISYGKVNFSDDIGFRLCSLINENLTLINEYYNINANCEKNNSIITIEECITSGNINDEIILIEMLVPYLVTYNNDITKRTSTLYIKVYNYITVISNDMIELNGVNYNFESFKQSNNIFR